MLREIGKGILYVYIGTMRWALESAASMGEQVARAQKATGGVSALRGL